MKKTSCPSVETLLDQPDDPVLRRHVATCLTCQASLQKARELTTALRCVPTARLHPEAAVRIEGALLAAARDHSPRRSAPRWPLALALTAVVAAGGWLLVGHDPRPPPSAEPTVAGLSKRGIIEPLGHADFTHTVTSSPGGRTIETVVLTLGRLRISVDRVRPTERFVVRVGGDEVEVRGTRFIVEARGQALARVTVEKGRVEVRPAGRRPRVLTAAETWRAPVFVEAPPNRAEPTAVEEIPPEKAASASARRRRTVRRATSSRRPSPLPVAEPDVPRTTTSSRPARRERKAGTAEDAFAAGWRAMRAERFGVAAQAFAEAARSPALAEDAAYWRAVALGRAGHDGAAEAFAHFLERYPASSWAGAVRAMLGWLYLDDGRTDDARRLFDEAIDSTDPDVRRSAQRGLNALGSDP